MEIDYDLFSRIEKGLLAEYVDRIYREEPPTYYDSERIWCNVGVRLVHSNFTIAVLCEYDENAPGAGVYVGVKILDGSGDANGLVNWLVSKGYDNKFPHQLGKHKRPFSWAYSKEIADVKQGIDLFHKLYDECNAFLCNQIF